MKYNITVLKGDGIGPEVVDQTIEVLDAVGRKFGIELEYNYKLMGGCAIDAFGEPLPAATLEACRKSDAVLLGAVGGPKWDGLPGNLRPEAGLLGLRAGLGLYANLRPAVIYDALRNASPLKTEIISGGIDIMVVRELTGGIYFGERGRSDIGTPDEAAFDTEKYSIREIERIARTAFEAARKRRKLLTSNMFGDILSDEASMITGSIGMLPSASLGDGTLGLYEPIHGSAPDIAGQDRANPIATVLSAAMLLKYSLGRDEAAACIEKAVEKALEKGYRTGDIASEGCKPVGTGEMGRLIREEL